MGKLKGFLEYDRKVEDNKPVYDRLKNYNEFTIKYDYNEVEKQGSRCMDCGVPFCHSGCPLGNLIPEFKIIVSSSNHILVSGGLLFSLLYFKNVLVLIKIFWELMNLIKLETFLIFSTLKFVSINGN